jgi:hypothetical protein
MDKTIVMVLTYAAGVYLCLRAWQAFQNSRYDHWLIKAQGWTEAPAEVLQTRNSFVSNRVHVDYRYHTPGGIFEGCCRVEVPYAGRYAQWNDPRREEAGKTIQEMRNTYVPGMQVTVRYDPNHPAHSVLWY